MKSFISIAIIFFLTASMPLLAQNRLSERIRNAQLQDAALRAVEESVQVLQEQVSESKVIREVLLSDPEQHRKRAQSYQLLHDEEQTRLREVFRRQLALFAEHAPELPAQWAETTIAKHSPRVDAAIQPLLQTRFRAAYQTARQSVLKTQVEKLERSTALYAEPEEIEDLVSINEVSRTPLSKLARVFDKPAGRRLVDQYADAIRQSEVLFEENESVLDAKIRNRFKAQIVELQTQVNAVHSYFVNLQNTESVDAPGIEQQILQQVRPSPEHSVFPGVQQLAMSRAEKIERQLWRLH